jgi:lysophospholipase L1-like esterase
MRNIVVSFFILIFLSLFISTSQIYAATILSPESVISRNVPAYTNNDYNGAFSPSMANDDDYLHFWITNNVPAYVAYDLSAIPTAQRGQVVVIWYNDPATKPFNPDLIGDLYYRVPQDYTIEANPALGGTFPATGWVTLATVSSNPYTSRQHLLNLTGYNWVRINMSSCPGVFSIECGINMDVQNAANGASDDWMFFGDSITSIAMDHDPLTSDGGSGTFSQLINAQNSNYFPVQQNGGTGGWASADPLAGTPSYFSTWLALFPGNFVALDYGTNDANNYPTTGGNPNSGAVTAFYNNMTTMVQAVIAAGKIPVIPKIPWGNTANIQANGPAMNAKIDQLYSDFPQIVPGPDLWTYFSNNQSLISGDNVHPNNVGMFGIRQLWADKMISDVYTAPTVSASPVGGSYSTTQSITLTGSANTTIYYTLDGTTPTINSTLYNSPISVSSTKTLKFIALNKGLNSSTVQSEAYTILVPTATPAPTSTPSSHTTNSTSNSDSSTTDSKLCTNQSPGAKTPSLYGVIAHDTTTIEVYFTNADKPLDHYTLEYGTKSGEYQYGINSFGDVSKDQQSYIVKSLQPNTTYYFRVRGGNGCATGDWSNELSTTTKAMFATNQLDITSSTLNPVNEKPSITPTPSSTLPQESASNEKTYSINIVVKDTNNQPIEGAEVTMHSKVQTAITNKDGIAHFDNVEQGNHKVIIASNNFKGEESLNLSGDVKEFNLNVQVKPQNVLLTPQVITIISAFILVIIVLLVLLRRKNTNLAK